MQDKLFITEGKKRFLLTFLKLSSTFLKKPLWRKKYDSLNIFKQGLAPHLTMLWKEENVYCSDLGTIYHCHNTSRRVQSSHLWEPPSTSLEKMRPHGIWTGGEGKLCSYKLANLKNLFKDTDNVHLKTFPVSDL